jgi:transcriptional regulator with XRE-family HTH domain
LPKGLHDDRYREVIGKLVERRRAIGLRQEDVAARLGLRQWDVSRYESGERRLDFVELVDVARALEIDAAMLVESVPVAGQDRGQTDSEMKAKI